MTSKHINIKADSRVAIVGKTGSGKTFAAWALLASVPRLLVIDPKGSLGDAYLTRKKQPLWNLTDIDSYNARRVVRAIERGEPGRLRIPPMNLPAYERYVNWAHSVGGITVYIDELYGYLGKPTSTPPPALSSAYTRGREWGVGVWASTQRPRWIPGFFLSEAEWLLAFRLSKAADRAVVAEIGGDALNNPIAPRQFYLYNESWDEPLFYGDGINIRRKGGQ